MEISNLTLKLILLLIPGLIASVIHKKLTISTKQKTETMFFVNSLLFGILSYISLQLFINSLIFFNNHLSISKYGYKTLDAFESITNSDKIPFDEIFFAIIVGVFIGFISARFDHHKTLYRISHKFNVTNKYGDENLFSYFLNKSDMEWVYVRDIKNNLTYLGSIKMFSESDQLKEIVLNDVIVYNYPDSVQLYTINSIYLSLPINEIIIEKAIY